MQSIRNFFRHSPLLNGLFGALACAIALLITTAPAFAQSPTELVRVEVHGRTVEMPVRYDVSKACAGLADQLEEALQATWMDAQRSGEVSVQMVMNAGDISGVQTDGMSAKLGYAVRRAVNRLQCDASTADDAIYRFRVAFVMPQSGGKKMSPERRIVLLAPANGSAS